MSDSPAPSRRRTLHHVIFPIAIGAVFGQIVARTGDALLAASTFFGATAILLVVVAVQQEQLRRQLRELDQIGRKVLEFEVHVIPADPSMPPPRCPDCGEVDPGHKRDCPSLKAIH